MKSIFLNEFVNSVKGEFFASAHFASSHKLVSNAEFRSFSNTHKLVFSKCFNVVKFKTADANWELFFHLVKEGGKFSEILNVRVFPKHIKIRSEGNVEKNYSRLNIFTNNRYLTSVLESQITNDFLKWLIRHNGDILLISHNNLHFKAFLMAKNLNVSRSMDMVKAMNGIKTEIYKLNTLEY